MRNSSKMQAARSTKQIVSFLFIVFCCMNCSSNNKLADLDFLVGTWKVEGKERYEVWKRGGADLLEGTAYKIEDGAKISLETLAIRVTGASIVYEATVPDQNDGQTILFTLNADTDGSFVFENPNHDFPKKIIYKIEDSDNLLVHVLGDDDQGFSMKFVRQND